MNPALQVNLPATPRPPHPPPATEGFSLQNVRQEGVTVRCKRFRGTFLEVVGPAVGGAPLAHPLSKNRRIPAWSSAGLTDTPVR